MDDSAESEDGEDDLGEFKMRKYSRTKNYLRKTLEKLKLDGSLNQAF